MIPGVFGVALLDRVFMALLLFSSRSFERLPTIFTINPFLQHVENLYKPSDIIVPYLRI